MNRKQRLLVADIVPEFGATEENIQQIIMLAKELRNIIFLQIRVNNSQPLWFVLDTGPQLTIIDDERAKLSGIKFSIVGKAEDAGGSPVDAGLAKDVSFQSSGLDFQARQTGIIPLSELDHYIGRTVDGTLPLKTYSL